MRTARTALIVLTLTLASAVVLQAGEGKGCGQKNREGKCGYRKECVQKHECKGKKECKGKHECTGNQERKGKRACQNTEKAAESKDGTPAEKPAAE